MSDTFREMILNAVQVEIERALAGRADPRMGRITSYDSTLHAVKVAVLPEADFPLQDGDDAGTGWIPLAPVCAGNGWGVYAPPAIGTQVMLNHQEGYAGSAVALASINDESNVPPEGVMPGEILLRHTSGSLIKLANDQSVSVAAADGLTINVISGNAAITVSSGDANITASGKANLLSAQQVNLGAVGGKKVVRDGDPVSTGGVVQATTETVFSA